VTFLLQNRVDDNCLDVKGITPLNLAEIKGYTEIIKIQLLHGQEVTIMNGLGTVFYIWR
jgi:ankyrin repeat protein